MIPRQIPARPLRVWTGASYLDIYGTDGDGILLLAVVPLYDLEIVEGTHEVTLDSGQKLLFTIFDIDEDGEQFYIQLAYEEAWHALPQALLQNLHSWWNGNLRWQRSLGAPAWRSSLPLGSAARLIFVAGIATYFAYSSIPSLKGDVFLASLYNEPPQLNEPKTVSRDDEDERPVDDDNEDDSVEEDEDTVNENIGNEAPRGQDSASEVIDPNLMKKLTSKYLLD